MKQLLSSGATENPEDTGGWMLREILPNFFGAESDESLLSFLLFGSWRLTPLAPLRSCFFPEASGEKRVSTLRSNPVLANPVGLPATEDGS
jgi:hypothetical protein